MEKVEMGRGGEGKGGEGEREGGWKVVRGRMVKVVRRRRKEKTWG